jgi:hypothetical protein
MLTPEHLREVQLVCASAKEMTEGGHTYVHMPVLRLPEGYNPREVEALLWLTSSGTYPTRLFLSQIVSGKGANWTSHVILGKTWHTWSWKDIPGSLRPAEILAAHLRGLR